MLSCPQFSVVDAQEGPTDPAGPKSQTDHHLRIWRVKGGGFLWVCSRPNLTWVCLPREICVWKKGLHPKWPFPGPH